MTREFKTASGLPRSALYTARGRGRRPTVAIGDPGAYPFTRGLYPAGYRGRLWTMRQYAGFATAAESNRRYRYLLEQGTTGLSVAFDLPTQIGYDSDDSALGGRGGSSRRRHRQPRGHGDAARRHPPRSRLDLHDDQRHGRDAPRPLHRRGPASRHPRGVAVGDRPERHPQGVRGPRDLHLPPGSLAAAGDRRLHLLRGARSQVESRSRSPGYHIREAGATAVAGAGVHLRPRPRVRACGRRGGTRPRALRGAGLVLLRLSFRLHRGDREVPRGPASLGAPHEGPVRAWRTRRPSTCASTSRPGA